MGKHFPLAGPVHTPKLALLHELQDHLYLSIPGSRRQGSGISLGLEIWSWRKCHTNRLHDVRKPDDLRLDVLYSAFNLQR